MAPSFYKKKPLMERSRAVFQSGVIWSLEGGYLGFETVDFAGSLPPIR